MGKGRRARRLTGAPIVRFPEEATLASPNASEPRAEGSDWVDWGGERVWAVGFTEGGAPFGLSVEEFRAAQPCRAFRCD